MKATDLSIDDTLKSTVPMECADILETTDFDSLKLIEKPDSPFNSLSLPQTLEGCVGYLKELPLKVPNVDQKNPATVVDMINILTSPSAVEAFENAQQSRLLPTDEESPLLDGNESVYDYARSSVMNRELGNAKKRISHTPNILCGHVVRPGNVSLYTKDGKTYAAGEGCWFLTLFRAFWVSGGCNVSLDTRDVIAPPSTTILIVRVLAGEVGLVLEQGVARLLDVGAHVYNSGTVRLVKKQKYAEQNFFKHGPFNYLRVPRGQLAKVWVEAKSDDGTQSLVPRLLKEGEHYVRSNLFQFIGLVNASDDYIEHGSVHMLSIPKGSVAKVFHDNKPRLLGEGTHTIESTNFEYVGVESLISNPYVVHGTMTILRVTLGNIGLAWNNNEPQFIDKPGLYEFDSADFTFVGFKSADERIIELGAKKIVQVFTGEVAVTYSQGELKVLDNGRHIIESSTHIFERFLSTKQKSIRLMTLHASEKNLRSSRKGKKDSGDGEKSKKKDKSKIPCASFDDDKDSDLTICETKDLVKVGIRADVFYSIADPVKCISNIDTEELDDLVRETAVATLTNIIRSTGLNQIAQSKQVSAGALGHVDDSKKVGSSATLPYGPGEGINGSAVPTSNTLFGMVDAGSEVATPPPASAPMFFDVAHDEFLEKLHGDFMDRYGVDIANIRMESFKIMDQELSYQMSKQALTTAQVENELANLEGQSLILTQKERTAAEVHNINADAEARALKTKNDAENLRRIEAAQAEAEALKIAARAGAEAESQAVLMRAEAEAKAAVAEADALKIAARARAEAESSAILMKAEAEAEAIRLKAAAESERAGVLSRTKLGQQESLLGIYSDMIKHSNQGVEKVVYLDPSVNRDSPFSLGSMNNLNRDLHALSTMGVACESALLEGAAEGDGQPEVQNEGKANKEQ
mmetsp:Transcript_35197/g.105126  ORF Transcript_35197/g.105126 Transcript_35197/m.105126 type:complete len:919 (-) Transcript_35197:150-2906(-)